MSDSEHDTKRNVGRPALCPTLIEIARHLRSEGMSYRDIEIVTGVSRTSAWRYEHEKDKSTDEELEG